MRELRTVRGWEPLGFYPGKRAWWGDKAGGDSSIRILDAEFEYDDGKYVCLVTWRGRRSQEMSVDVKCEDIGEKMFQW